MTKRRISGLAAAAVIGLGVPAALHAAPVDDQYGGGVSTETTPAVVTTTTAASGTAATTTTTTTGQTTTGQTTTGQTTTGQTTTEQTVPATRSTHAVTTPSTPSTPSGGGEAPQVAQQGSLPFTGLELGLFVLGGVAAVGAGLVLRRAAGRRS